MNRAVAQRRGGAAWVIAGFLGVGGSSALLLAAGPRALGVNAFSGLALVWTVSSIFGLGIASPTEQVLSRRLNVGTSNPVRQPTLALAGTGVLVIVAATLFDPKTAAARNFGSLTLGIVIAVLGWVAVTLVRGRLAGSGDLTVYSKVLAVETVSRVGFIAIALLDRSAAGATLTAGIGGPLLIAAGFGSYWLVRPMSVVAVSRVDAMRSEQAAFVLVSLGFQVCLNAPPLLLEWRAGSAAPAVVGAFVAANSYFRTPTVLMGGVATHALVEMSHAWGQNDRARLRRALRMALRNILISSGAATCLAAALAPFLLPIYYGSRLHLPLVLLAALAVSSILAVVAAILVQPLLAAGVGKSAAGVWTVAAISTLAIVSISDGTGTLAAIGLVVGPALATIGAARSVKRLLHRSTSFAIAR